MYASQSRPRHDQIPCLRSIPNRLLPGQVLLSGTSAQPTLNRAADPPRQAKMPAKETIMPKVERVIPVLTYQDIRRRTISSSMRSDSLPAACLERRRGQPIHGEVRAGDATIWLHRVTAEHGLNSPLASDVAHSGLFVYVDDVDAHYRQARAAGAPSILNPSINRMGSASTARGIRKEAPMVVCHSPGGSASGLTTFGGHPKLTLDS